ALVFFVALGLGVRAVLLTEVFPIDQVELEPPKAADPGLLGMVFGAKEPPGISEKSIARLRASPAVLAVYPKLRFAFPASAHGGKELIGRDIGTAEMVADGIDPKLVSGDVLGKYPFVDPLAHPGKPCRKTRECEAPRYCEGPANSDGVCVEPVPVLVSRYLVEMFDKSIAPAHNLPPIGETLITQARGMVFKMWLGESVLGKAKKGGPRHVHARVVGVSPRAIDIGITLPLETVRRFNREYAGEGAANKYSSALVKVSGKDRVSEVIALGRQLDLTPKDTRARDVSVLLSGIMALLALVAGIILLVSASNIAYTFRVFVSERRREIALYRALGATRADMAWWLVALALTVGALSGAVGVLAAWLLSRVANYLAATKLPDFPFKPDTFFAFPPWLVFGALGFAALFALLGAIGPARRAGRVDPASALAAL
ncbi:MAG TPA: ABC transporter permease, partial [Sorangium sp.]|nr:ABC transporter permease [Sorangium sp.]